MKTCGIYWIRNKINNHIYIGHSVDLKSRRRSHKTELKRGVSPHRLLQEAADEFGLKNFSFRTLITCHPDMLLWYEQQFIDQWKPEYNIHPRADSSNGIKRSEEAKKNMSLAQTGRTHSEETKMKMCASQRKRRELERNRR
jgi:group I intron endonuclease